MQKQEYTRPSTGTKTTAIDQRELLLRHRLLQLMAAIVVAATALGLYQIFIR